MKGDDCRCSKCENVEELMLSAINKHDSSKIRNPRKEQKFKIVTISSIAGGPTMFGVDAPEEILKTDPSRLAKNTLPRN